MSKPIIKTIHAFDARMPYTVEFTWSGNQVYGNRMVIYDAATQAVVYDDSFPRNPYKLEHVIPANKLANNKQYAVQISVFDINRNASPFSDKYYFWTIETPAFYFNGLVNGQTIYSSSISLDLVYEQSGSESLIWTQFFLYDASKTEIAKTEVDYSCSLTHIFRTLKNKETQYVRAAATTVHGMVLDTGLIGFVPSYKNPSTYARVYAENDEDTGFVNYYSNVVIIPPDEENYDYEDSFIDLTEIDSSATLNIHATTSPFASMDIYWENIYNESLVTNVPDSNEGTTLTEYKYVKELTVNGRSVQGASPSHLGDIQPITSLSNVDLYIKGNVIRNISDSLMLNKLPPNSEDHIVVKNDGTRIYIHAVGYHVFSPSDAAIRIETVGGEFITYYDLGGMVGSAPENIRCTCIPVNTDDTTSISMDPETGYVKIVWRADSSVTSEDEVRQYFYRNAAEIIYPLQKITQTELSRISPMPSMTNQKLLRYSQNLVVPGGAATFAIRMKACRKTANLLKVYSEEDLDFILSSIVYEDGTYRLKLTVYDHGPTYTQYSNQLEIDSDDIVTVYIRRIDGIYGMYISTQDASDVEYVNIWLGIPEPDHAEDKDLWIDLNQGLVYIAETDAVRIYQPTEPTDAENNNIWIGGEL